MGGEGGRGGGGDGSDGQGTASNKGVDIHFLPRHHSRAAIRQAIVCAHELCPLGQCLPSFSKESQATFPCRSDSGGGGTGWGGGGGRVSWDGGWGGEHISSKF